MGKNRKKRNVIREFKLTSLSVENKTTVYLLTLMIVIFGFSAYKFMPKEQFPEIIFPQIYIGTAYPGNSPVDMENLIARPIEKELKSINGVKKITSTNIQDYSTIIIDFNTDVEISRALQDVKDAVDKAKKDLPSDLPTEPNIFDLDLSEVPVMFINISGDYSLDELKIYAEYLEEKIEALPEVSKVEIRGLPAKEVQINVDLPKMESLQISFGDIENAVRAENVTMSGGNLLVDGFRRSIRIAGEFEAAEEIENVIVKDENQDIVFLGDIAEVKLVNEEVQSIARLDGLPVVTLDVVKRSGENLIEAADKIKVILDKAQKEKLPDNLNIAITNDQSKFTRKQIDNLENSIISGVILVVLVLLFFLGFRNSLFVGVAIPLSMLMGFLVLSIFGVSINMIVLFSLILALGMLVDNGIVVVENIYRLMQEGYSPVRAAKEGAGEVAWPIIASTATTVAAFLPLAFWTGIMGEFMKFLPITLMIVLTCSLFVALVINPVLTAKFMKVEDIRTKLKYRRLFIVLTITLVLTIIGHFIFEPLRNIGIIVFFITLLDAFVLRRGATWFQNSFLPFIENTYHRTLKVALNGRMPYIFLGGTFLLLIFAIMLTFVRQPKVDLFPNNEPQYINIYVDMPIGTDIQTTNDVTKDIEEIIFSTVKDKRKNVESIITQIGEGTSDPSQGPSGGTTPNKARISITFVDYEFRDASTAAIMEELREVTAGTPGAVITVEKNPMGPPVGKPINIEVSGDDLDTLITRTEDIKRLIEDSDIEGYEELKTDVEINKPELLVNIDRAKARRFGLSTYRIANEIRTALFGKEISKFKEGEDKYPIQLRLMEKYRYDEDYLMNQRITFRDPATGKINQVPISAVADESKTTTFNSVKRKDLDRMITLYSNVKEGANANEIVVQMKELLSDYRMPDGYEIKFTGEQQEQEESGAFLMRAMMIAVFLIFLIIVTQFNSFGTPFIIMLSVLFSTIGVFLGLSIFNMDFIIIMTGIGIISLAGVVVNNAIVLIDYVNLIRERRRIELNIPENERLPEEEVKLSIMNGGKIRLRPVLLTAITTVLGLIPLAIGLNINFFTLITDFNPDIYMGGDNAIFWGPMAWTVIFGLIFSTFLTLVIVPVMYLILEKIKWAIVERRKEAKVIHHKEEKDAEVLI